jgi:hypothetical protein
MLRDLLTQKCVHKKSLLILDSPEQLYSENIKLKIGPSSQELQVKNCKSRIASQELQVKNCMSRIANQELKLKNCKSRIASQELQVKNCKSRIASQELQVKNFCLAA